MGKIVEHTARLVGASKKAYAKKWSFFGLFLLVFFGAVVTLGRLDLLPSVKGAGDTLLVQEKVSAAVAAPDVVELPTKIEIPTINLMTVIANPTTTDIATLDGELLKGAVRYPTSAKLGETGNVVLFGHSSYLPIVRNQAYKAFNGIQKLVAGDTITVYSSDTAYTYRVERMEKESANDAGIPLVVSGRMLTLSTCDSFGEKADRFVVTARFVESHVISG